MVDTPSLMQYLMQIAEIHSTVCAVGSDNVLIAAGVLSEQSIGRIKPRGYKHSSMPTLTSTVAEEWFVNVEQEPMNDASQYSMLRTHAQLRS
jgi:hypothetical protein